MVFFVLLWQPEVITVPRMCMCLSLCPQENNTSKTPHPLTNPNVRSRDRLYPLRQQRKKSKFPAGLRLCNMNKLKGTYFYADLLKTLWEWEECSAHITLQKSSEGRKCLAEGGGREKALSSLLIRSSIDLTHFSAETKLLPVQTWEIQNIDTCSV